MSRQKIPFVVKLVNLKNRFSGFFLISMSEKLKLRTQCIFIDSKKWSLDSIDIEKALKFDVSSDLIEKGGDNLFMRNSSEILSLLFPML